MTKSPEQLENITENASDVITAGDILDTFERLAESYCIECKVETVSDLTQLQFSGLCMYIYANFLKHHKRDLLQSEVLYDIPNTFISSNYNSYDIDKLYIILQCFVYLSNKYNKIPTSHGFLYLTGINSATFEEWGRDNGVDQVSRKRVRFYKIVKEIYLTSIQDDLLNGRKNPVGLFGVINREFPDGARGNDSVQALPASALPRLSVGADHGQIVQHETGGE